VTRDLHCAQRTFKSMSKIGKRQANRAPGSCPQPMLWTTRIRFFRNSRKNLLACVSAGPPYCRGGGDGRKGATRESKEREESEKKQKLPNEANKLFVCNTYLLHSLYIRHFGQPRLGTLPAPSRACAGLSYFLLFFPATEWSCGNKCPCAIVVEVNFSSCGYRSSRAGGAGNSGRPDGVKMKRRRQDGREVVLAHSQESSLLKGVSRRCFLKSFVEGDR